jgi:hypothetical protein
MSSNHLAFAALGVACVAAAAGGSYLATRQAVQNSSAAVEQAPVAPPASKPEGEPAEVAPAQPEAAPVKNAPSRTGTRDVAPKPAPKTTAATRRAAPPEPRVEPRREPPVVERPSPAPAQFEPPPPAVPSQAEIPVPSLPPPVFETRPLEVDPRIEPEPSIEELVVTADSVIGLELESTVSSDRAQVEDAVEARVVRDVRVGRRVAIPAGSRALGSVVVAERGGRFKERARLGVRFHTLLLRDGTRLPMTTETIYRYGEAPGDASAKKIGGGAVAGAILGAIVGGAKGAAIGATAGAGGGTAVVMAGERSAATFLSGSEVTARIIAPVTITPDR